MKVHKPLFPECAAVVVQMAAAPGPDEAGCQKPESGKVPLGVLASSPPSPSRSEPEAVCPLMRREHVNVIALSAFKTGEIRMLRKSVPALNHTGLVYESKNWAHMDGTGIAK